jgi:hypothetical protein
VGKKKANTNVNPIPANTKKCKETIACSFVAGE